jgi:hypothetical protein
VEHVVAAVRYQAVVRVATVMRLPTTHIDFYVAKAIANGKFYEMVSTASTSSKLIFIDE